MTENKLTKINYVYLKSKDKSELHDIIEWCGKKRLVIDMLNLLTDSDSDPAIADDFETMENIEKYIKKMYAVKNEYIHHNRNSLPSRRLLLANGCTINLKINQLNTINVFGCCSSCTEKEYCIEGIAAIRVTQDGNIQPCLLRTDNCLALNDVQEDMISVKLSEYLSSLCS